MHEVRFWEGGGGSYRTPPPPPPGTAVYLWRRRTWQSLRPCSSLVEHEQGPGEIYSTAQALQKERSRHSCVQASLKATWPANLTRHLALAPGSQLGLRDGKWRQASSAQKACRRGTHARRSFSLIGNTLIWTAPLPIVPPHLSS